jgi:hypothetical protein
MTTTRWVSLLVFAVGCGITSIGVGLYEAWWTIAFAIGGALVGLFGPRLTSPARPLAIGTAASGAALLAGMSVFFLFGGVTWGGTPWLLAGFGSMVAATVLALVVRRLLKPSGQAHDIRET